MNRRNIRGRLDRLERADPTPRVTVWDVMWGYGDPSELTGVDLEIWTALTESPREPYHDPIEEEIARIGRGGGPAEAPQADEPVVRTKSGAG